MSRLTAAAAQVRAALARTYGPVDRAPVAQLLDALDDLVVPSQQRWLAIDERLALAEGRLTLEQAARNRGESLDTARRRLYGDPA